MPTVFVVMGQTGEYSDRYEWPVAGFLDESAAQARVRALDEWLRLHRLHMDDAVHVSYDRRIHKTQNPLDPDCSIDYTGTRYYVLSVPLLESSQAVPAVESAAGVREG